MISRIKPTLNLPFYRMQTPQRARDVLQNVGASISTSNGTVVNKKGLIESVPGTQMIQQTRND